MRPRTCAIACCTEKAQAQARARAEAEAQAEASTVDVPQRLEGEEDVAVVMTVVVVEMVPNARSALHVALLLAIGGEQARARLSRSYGRAAVLKRAFGRPDSDSCSKAHSRSCGI